LYNSKKELTLGVASLVCVLILAYLVFTYVNPYEVTMKSFSSNIHNSPKLKQLANKITQPCENKAYFKEDCYFDKIALYVYNNIKYNENISLSDPEEILKKGEGNCVSKASLFAGLMCSLNGNRLNGIRVYFVSQPQHLCVLVSSKGKASSKRFFNCGSGEIQDIWKVC